MSRNTVPIIAGELVRPTARCRATDLDGLVGPIGTICVTVAKPSFMDAVKFVQASKFVVTAVDKAGVLADLRAALKRNDMSYYIFPSKNVLLPQLVYSQRRNFSAKKNVPSGWSLCHDEWIANSW